MKTDLKYRAMISDSKIILKHGLKNFCMLPILEIQETFTLIQDGKSMSCLPPQIVNSEHWTKLQNLRQILKIRTSNNSSKGTNFENPSKFY